MVNLGNSWDGILAEEFTSEYYQNLREFLKREYRSHKVYPDMYDIFNALKTTDYEEAKVVILGQDPYHEPGQAHGMAFSVKPGIEQPPSLRNIFKELHDDLGLAIPPRDNGYLLPWAKQGVLLLNTCLTVREHQANSHRGKGWEIFTDHVIEKLNQLDQPIVFLLWGNNARAKMSLLNNPRHLVLTAAHPSPLSAYNGFFGCRHFSRTNEFLEKNGVKPIDWKM